MTLRGSQKQRFNWQEAQSGPSQYNNRYLRFLFGSLQLAGWKHLYPTHTWSNWVMIAFIRVNKIGSLISLVSSRTLVNGCHHKIRPTQVSLKTLIISYFYEPWPQLVRISLLPRPRSRSTTNVRRYTCVVLRNHLLWKGSVMPGLQKGYREVT